MGKKSIAAIVLALLLGVAGYVTDGKSIEEAVKIAFGTDAEKTAYCAEVLKGE